MIQIIQGAPHLDHWSSQREKEMFEYLVRMGEIWQGLIDGELVACWGVVPPSFLSDSAYVYMIDIPCSRPLLLARHSREVIKALLQRWPRLYGQCKLNAWSSQRWLKWLGAEFSEPVNGTRPFVINRSS